jgi:hypothetical protein
LKKGGIRIFTQPGAAPDRPISHEISDSFRR